MVLLFSVCAVSTTLVGSGTSQLACTGLSGSRMTGCFTAALLVAWSVLTPTLPGSLLISPLQKSNSVRTKGTLTEKRVVGDDVGNMLGVGEVNLEDEVIEVGKVIWCFLVSLLAPDLSESTIEGLVGGKLDTSTQVPTVHRFNRFN